MAVWNGLEFNKFVNAGLLNVWIKKIYFKNDFGCVWVGTLHRYKEVDKTQSHPISENINSVYLHSYEFL